MQAPFNRWLSTLIFETQIAKLACKSRLDTSAVMLLELHCVEIIRRAVLISVALVIAKRSRISSLISNISRIPKMS
jgi:hypothetical protein